MHASAARRQPLRGNNLGMSAGVAALIISCQPLADRGGRLQIPE